MPTKKPNRHVPRGAGRYTADSSIRGKPFKVIAISMPVDEIKELEVICAAVQMSRSHFLRQAARRFRVWIEGPRNGMDPAARMG